jgi:hypothetical protein
MSSLKAILFCLLIPAVGACATGKSPSRASRDAELATSSSSKVRKARPARGKAAAAAAAKPQTTQPSSVQPHQAPGRAAPGQTITATATPQFLPNQTIARAKFEPTPDGKVVVASMRSARTISMFYRLDLRRDNVHARELARILDGRQQELRECYTDRLDKTPALRGQIVFAFELSKQKRSMLNIQRTGGSLGDKQVADCLRKELEGLAFSLPNDMRGTLAYDFDAFVSGSPFVASNP